MTQTLATYLKSKPAELAKGPLAIILCEDKVEIESTIQHHVQAGFRTILLLSAEPLDLPQSISPAVRNLIYPTRQVSAHKDAVNMVIDAVPERTWIYYGFNAEYLFYPFSETRSVNELLSFHTEERRWSMLTYVIDLYASNLKRDPDAVSLTDAMFDRTGYYALTRVDKDGRKLDRQYDFHGGLRWRFEEFLPVDRRRIDRISLFRTQKGLRLRDDHRFNIEEYNTYANPWHHNLTAAIASFRVAKALVRNPVSRIEIDNFTWRHSHPFRWNAQQLMNLGLMEPGQWF